MSDKVGIGQLGPLKEREQIMPKRMPVARQERLHAAQLREDLKSGDLSCEQRAELEALSVAADITVLKRRIKTWRQDVKDGKRWGDKAHTEKHQAFLDADVLKLKQLQGQN